ncbi:MAG: glyceraldehyde-3-phosphate:ferredoxin oxidoreductase [Candidatus Aenigmarchaeota archaeon]|nr:glyceraldehyde-3-phosphate:ferredoxin oxidoreductase [Candidatus Aenigmarchaeota archaeon]
MMKKVIEINAGKGSFKSLLLESDNVIGVVDYAVDAHMSAKTYEYGVLDSRNSLIFGAGPLAGSKIPGANRLIIVGHSPVVETLFLSTIGGAALPLYKTGVDFVKIEGKSKKPSILVIKNISGKMSVKFYPIEQDELMDVFSKDDLGVYSLHDYVVGKYKDEFLKNKVYLDFRVLAVGPAAMNTNQGAISTLVIRNGNILKGSDGWAGRGGFGSVLFQAHNIVAVMYGGDRDDRVFEPKDLKDMKAVDEIFTEHLGANMTDSARKATEKYRYVEKYNSGGTFGVNMSTIGAWLPMFNWSSVYLSRDKRQDIYDKFIVGHYLKQFNEETIDTKLWRTCGEPCPAVCKKYKGDRKKDYEPYEALGPNAGIFDQRAAEKLVGAVECMGYDAIGFGNLVSFVLECMHKGLLTKEDVGVDVDANFDAETFKMKDSFKHADIGVKLAFDIAYQRTEFSKMFRHGVRSAVRKLSEKYSDRESEFKFSDLANYIPFGLDGYIAPCQYWVPGFFIPLQIQGKFYSYYGNDFYPPEDLGAKSVDRSVKELFSGNTGICRFHRGWSEKLVETLIAEGCGVKVDYYEHCRKLLQKLRDYDTKAGVVPVFWETKRVHDVIRTYLYEARDVSGTNPEIEKWIKRFEKDEMKAAKAYWHDLLVGVNKTVDWGDIEHVKMHYAWDD